MNCPACGNVIDTASRFCCHCGARVAGQAYAGSLRSRYFRPREGRMIAGVCAGIALYHGWDIALVRLVTALLILFIGLPIAAYFLAWIVMPNGDYAIPPTTGVTAS